ncbi:MAG: hypothetical protein A2W90_16760 [Bacteroidetes bacterium GWF2_42_66]|nr:MAG: hypothetical protein A2W92_03855 [Bacteroidetes bacterium GWA2_42_15]OFX96344.1 MAG: hypothetical protein A2W89_05690 [Bacteroidetes bacterium GWE2_42_39]OFY46383.1 MAG: hypothetical protein A2W90_16760 [Bacteroidetes bacterium GWF2_42_66]HBL78231.1 hypothetical protein [Prolixibacteraceae bacterium]HCR89931.1 hypothetical protein [Prolixibacteraceae bacterium]
MEQNNVSPLKTALTYGIYMAIISIVISLIIWATSLMESLGLMGATIIGLVNLAITVVLLVIFTKLYRDNLLGGTITFGKAFSFGVLVVVCSSLITGLFSYILHKYIDPGYMGRIMTMMQEKMYQMFANKGMSEEQIDAAMRAFEEKGIPSPLESVKSALLGGLIGGAIMSLISAAIVKKNTQKEDAFEEAMEEIKTEE